jgi:adenine/guanine phosphoribosyltransferase-like PRPP-binding protein
LCFVLQVDDLIATGGTLRAGINLMGEQQAAQTFCDMTLSNSASRATLAAARQLQHHDKQACQHQTATTTGGSPL